MDLRVEVVTELAKIPAAQWDAIAGDDDPFAEHAFLSALEESKSVGEEAGWMPLHVVVYEGTTLVAALPLYAKSHSYGEYIFDWGWANAAQRAGLRYYPKLVAMVPLTPATGRRFLLDRAAQADPARASELREALFAGANDIARHVKASGLHFNFLAPDEAQWLAEASGPAVRGPDDPLFPILGPSYSRPGLIGRTTVQFHWENQGYASFDAYLATWRAKTRKECKRERRKVLESGLELAVKTGPEMSAAEWAVLPRFYEDTCNRKGSDTYLTPEFFELLRTKANARVVCAFAYRNGEPVAATLNFEKGKNLYGRYWGASAEYEALHFELCYYQLIERCITRGLAHFEAGAQGEHKLRRGLLPAKIHSAHFLANPGLRAAVAAHVERENEAMNDYMAELASQGPFKRDGCED